MSQILFAGGRLDSVTAGTGVSEDTTAGRFDSTYCDAALLCSATTALVQATLVDSTGTPTNLTSGQTGYFHFEVIPISSTGSVGNWWWLTDSSGFPWLAIRSTGTGNVYTLSYNSGTGASPVWTTIGSSFTVPSATRSAIDIVLTIGSPHTAAIYLNGSLLVTGTFTQASLTTIRTLNLQSIGSQGNACAYSQILCTEGISTISAKIKYSRATGAGSNSAWTGAATNVNEAVNSDATIDQATSAGLRQTYAMGDVTVPSGYAIKSVFYWVRAKNDGSTPANIKASLRSGATNFDGASNLAGIGIGFAPLLQRYDTDPATSAAWTQTGWNAAEAGYLSAA